MWLVPRLAVNYIIDKLTDQLTQRGVLVGGRNTSCSGSNLYITEKSLTNRGTVIINSTKHPHPRPVLFS